MALRIKRGTNAERLSYTPELGELIYVTDYSGASVGPLWVGDGTTVGGNEISSGSGGGGGGGDVVSDTTPQLGGNLDLNSYDITGTGDIDTTGNINATGSIDVNLNIDAGGYVNATTMSANLFNGTFDGDVLGSIFGDDSTLIVDGNNKRVLASVWNATKAMVNVDLNKIETGQLIIEDTGIDRSTIEMIDNTYPDIIMKRTDAGDIGAVDPVSAYGTIRFKRDDVNGEATGVYMQGTSAGFAIYTLADGSTFDNNTRLSFTMDGNLGIGKATATQKLDVNGNAVISGSVTAASMKGTFVADDSTILVDGVAGKVNLAPNSLTDLGNVITSSPQAGQVLKYNGSEWVNGTDNAGSGGGGGGGGSIGVGADDSSVRLIESGESFLIKGGTNVTTTSDAEGNITIVSATEVASDTTPQLGGNLDLDSNDITGTGNINITGNVSATGNFQLGDSGSDIITFAGSTNGNIVPETTNTNTIGTNGLRWSNIYATAFTGDLTGDVTGNVSGTAGAVAFGDVTSTPTTLVGYGITDAATSAQGTKADSALQPAALGNYDFTGSTVDTNDSSGVTIVPAVTVQSDLTVENNLTVTNAVIADRFESTSTGTPEITAASNLNLTAGNAVVITQSPVRFASFTTTQRDTLASANGDMVYNTTTNKFQGYANGAWVDLH